MAWNTANKNPWIWYSKKIILLIKKWGKTFTWKAYILPFKNNELQIEIDWVEDKRNNTLFDSNVDIIIRFNFSTINEDLLGLLLLIYWIKKYSPKSINLILPYFPYTTKDMWESTNWKLNISTDSGLLTILQNSWISTIKTFDLWNKYVQNYSNIYIENITKKDIFIDEFAFFNKTKKKISIILLNQEDYNLFKSTIKDKENIHLIYLDEDLSSKSKTDQVNILTKLSDANKSIIYIFDKSLIRGNKIAQLLNILWANLDIKELNICITHGIFWQWSYRKFNWILEKFPYMNILTTNSILWYSKKILEDRISILKLPIMPVIKK